MDSNSECPSQINIFSPWKFIDRVIGQIGNLLHKPSNGFLISEGFFRIIRDDINLIRFVIPGLTRNPVMRRM